MGHTSLICKIYKYKAWLNAHGGQQLHGIHNWDTYIQTEFLKVYSDIKSQFEVTNEGPIDST